MPLSSDGTLGETPTKVVYFSVREGLVRFSPIPGTLTGPIYPTRLLPVDRLKRPTVHRDKQHAPHPDTSPRPVAATAAILHPREERGAMYRFTSSQKTKKTASGPSRQQTLSGIVSSLPSGTVQLSGTRRARKHRARFRFKITATRYVALKRLVHEDLRCAVRNHRVRLLKAHQKISPAVVGACTHNTATVSTCQGPREFTRGFQSEHFSPPYPQPQSGCI